MTTMWEDGVLYMSEPKIQGSLILVHSFFCSGGDE